MPTSSKFKPDTSDHATLFLFFKRHADEIVSHDGTLGNYCDTKIEFDHMAITPKHSPQQG